ncbi:TIR domain-containing protein [Piscinibacter sp. XHJ-5]|uniref:TIR domain-containing protein n=1 Tax=Piscinibacter sp. XHJ-5 TaxID=3037797 RepID=UPI002452AE64|nr:TIR domain-containing protein [Piscinibacter sp. XHJ-5]
MAALRSKLFLSYSKADTEWRDAFQRQLSAMFVSDDLWIDCESIPWGGDWEHEIRRAIAGARCALVLLTPAYLDIGRYARRELALLLAQSPPLKVLPVLVEDCPWSAVDKLERTQLVRWPGGVRVVGEGREEIAPLAESPHRDRSIIDICERARKEMGVVGQTRPEQMDALFDATQDALSEGIELQEAVHSGTFSVVYRAKLHDEIVAVKAVPDAPRQNRIRQIVTEALPKVHKLTDAAFIRVRDSNIDTEPHYFVMDYVDWPTIEQRLPTLPGHRVDAHTVAVVLAQVARAHRDAHDVGLLVGPLTLGSIHADERWQVRLSPLRIEGVLARAASMSTGQTMNWDALTYLAPEVSAGYPQDSADRRHLDALDQYYLGLLGLELLLGRPPCDVNRFDDLAIKARFFDDPRAFFDDGRGEAESWIDTHPALAYLLIRLLAREPEARLGSSEAVARDLDALAQERLPDSLRRQLDLDLDQIMTPDFADAFYVRLFSARPELSLRFSDRARQAHMLAAALPDLLAFDPEFPKNSRFAQLADKHAAYGIDGEDVEAFRSSFLAEVDEVFGSRAGHVEAWRAALDRGLGALGARLAGTGAAGAAAAR